MRTLHVTVQTCVLSFTSDSTRSGETGLPFVIRQVRFSLSSGVREAPSVGEGSDGGADVATGMATDTVSFRAGRYGRYPAGQALNYFFWILFSCRFYDDMILIFTVH